MNDTFFLNPFAFVTETDAAFFLCSSTALQVRLGKNSRSFIERVSNGEPITLQELRGYLALNSIQEMLSKHILIRNEQLPLEGRYSRQIGFFSLMFPDYRAVQTQIEKANILLLGTGAIGSHVLWNLAAMGVRKISALDFDSVDETNLNRQLLYVPADIGKSKVETLCAKIAEFNPEIEITPINRKICSAADIEEFVKGKTMIVKAIDTPEQSTEWANAVCVKHGIPLVTGGFLDYLGVVGPIYLPGKSTCVACMRFGRATRVTGTGPTFAPLTTLISARISMCIFKIIAGATENIANRLFTYDTVTETWETVPVTAAQSCEVCGREADSPAAVKNNLNRTLWAYRGGVLTVVALAGVIRGFTGDRYIGVLVLLCLFLSVPMLNGMLKATPQELRLQIFITSCIYVLGNVIIAGLLNIRPYWHTFSISFDLAFRVIQRICLVAVQAGVAITLLLFLLNAMLFALKITQGEKDIWTT